MIAQTGLKRATRADTKRQISKSSVKADTSKRSSSRAEKSTTKRLQNPRALKTDTSKLSRSRIIKKPVVRRRVIDSTRKANSLEKDGLAASRDTDKVILEDTPNQVAADVSKTPTADSTKTAAKLLAAKKPIDSFYLKLLDNPYIIKTGEPFYLIISERQRQSKDEMFYLLAGLLLFLAVLRLTFSKYFKNIFYLFFQPTFRQKQTREQLLQNSFPSLLLNLFFILSGAAYISFIITHYQLTNLNFWRLLIYSTALLLVLYTGKFLFLTFAGWVFDVKEATQTYIFAVYLINKILGVLLIPFIFIIAFSSDEVVETSITISLLLIGLLFIYRYLVSFAPVLREVKVNVLQFLFYIFAFEILPLLLIYKTLVIYLNKSL